MISRIIKAISKWWPKQFAEVHNSIKYKPVTHRDLEYRFADRDGLKYYGFEQNTELPMQRFNKMLEFYQWLANGITPSYLDEVLDIMEKALTKGLEQDKGAARIGGLIHELRTRKDMVIPLELKINILAVQYIREDEDPEKFSEAIHRDKVEVLMDQEELHSFFLDSHELKALQSLLGITNTDWMQYANQSKQAQRYREEVIKIYRS